MSLFFVWTVAWDRVLTGDNLWGRGFYFVDWCVMCRCCGKIVVFDVVHLEGMQPADF